jgi:hypothetical protein
MANLSSPAPKQGEKDCQMSDLLTLPLPPGFGIAIDLETGEVKKQIGPNNYQVDPVDLLINSFALRRAAGKLLSPIRKTLSNGDSVPAYRTVRCGNYLHSRTRGVELWKTPDAPRAHFGGLVTCGSQWLCPVCSLKIALTRRGEAQLAVQRLGERGGVCGLLTLTVPHQAGQPFEQVLTGIKRLYARWSSGKHSTQMRQRWPQLGFIRAVEVTKGLNGWHPHFHIVLFFSEPVVWLDVHQDFYCRWAAVAKREFGWSLPRASLDLRGHADAATYISKWSIEDELTLTHVKRARGQSLTPFELLASYANGNKQSGHDWREFATAVSPFDGERVHSTARLTWSKGLKRDLGISELTDEQIADAQDKRAHLLGTLSFDQWQKVLAQEHDIRPALLTLATQGTFEDVLTFVNNLPDLRASN